MSRLYKMDDFDDWWEKATHQEIDWSPYADPEQARWIHAKIGFAMDAAQNGETITDHMAKSVTLTMQYQQFRAAVNEYTNIIDDSRADLLQAKLDLGGASAKQLAEVDNFSQGGSLEEQFLSPYDWGRRQEIDETFYFAQENVIELEETIKTYEHLKSLMEYALVPRPGDVEIDPEVQARLEELGL